MSDGRAMELLREDWQSVMPALDVIAFDQAYLGEKLITEGGATGTYYCVQASEKSRFAAKEYRKYVTPSDVHVLARINRYSGYNILHCCGWSGKRTSWRSGRTIPPRSSTGRCTWKRFPLRKGDCTVDARIDLRKIKTVVEAVRSL